MILQVPFNDLVPTLNHFKVKEVFVFEDISGVHLSAALPEPDRSIYSRSTTNLEETKSMLTEAKIALFNGSWNQDISPEPKMDQAPLSIFVAAVSYRTEDHMPGVWVDAFPYQPTPVEAMRAIYEEFRDTGECQDVSFEEFIRIAKPNVAVVSHGELLTFASQHDLTANPS